MISKFNIPDEIFKEFVKIVKDKSINHNEKLAGNIKEEYLLNKYKKYFENFILSQIAKNDFFVNYLNNLNIFKPNSQKLMLESLWVNYQKKYEFNPVHNHDGVFSFIIFIQIPYTIEEEKSKSPGVKSNINCPGHLSFLFVDQNANGGIAIENIPVDKTWERTGLIFKSSLYHTVYPFYSEGERITVSGNIFFDNEGLKQ